MLVRHLTGDPPRQARAATSYLGSASELLLTDLVVAETIYVLDSFYGFARDRVADAVRALLTFESVVAVDVPLLLRAVEVYELDRIDFAEAYLVACAETTGVGAISSFDRSLDRVATIDRIDPAVSR